MTDRTEGAREAQGTTSVCSPECPTCASLRQERDDARAARGWMEQAANDYADTYIHLTSRAAAAEARVTELTEALALLIAANKKLFSGVDISLDYIDRMRAALGAQGERP